MLREINRDYNLELGKEFFSQTQRAGKKILDALKNVQDELNKQT